jgi:uridine kinase
MLMRHLIAVSGVMGSGKSSLVRGLAAELGDAATVYLDSYERFTEQSAAQVTDWARGGADYHGLSIPGLAEDLERLKGGVEIVEPRTNRRIAPTSHVLFETQFGRAHRSTGRHIDLLIWVETPLEVALARKVREQTRTFLDRNDRGECVQFLSWLDGWLANYLGFVRGLLVAQRDRVRPEADVILDGMDEPAVLVRRAAGEIRRRLP